MIGNTLEWYDFAIKENAGYGTELPIRSVPLSGRLCGLPDLAPQWRELAIN